MPRIALLYNKMEIQCPKQRDLKRQAKQAKAFMVLVKKKLTRDQVSRSKLFQKLLMLVFNPYEEAKKCCTHEVPYKGCKSAQVFGFPGVQVVFEPSPMFCLV